MMISQLHNVGNLGASVPKFFKMELQKDGSLDKMDGTPDKMKPPDKKEPQKKGMEPQTRWSSRQDGAPKKKEPQTR